MNQIDLAHRSAIITGAARGLGYTTAERFLQSGASVALWDIDEAALRAAAERLAGCGEVSLHVLDLSDEAAVGAATVDTLKAHGRIDILVNNAGITGGNGPRRGNSSPPSGAR